jgi:3-hydroxyisobutyrate dehydrogenase-like beta-hydroxyacid dehydrogenase
MATRSLDAGHDLTAWNRSPGRTKALADRGASVAPTPAQAVTDADVVITMLANPAALEQVVVGEDGAASALAPGQLLIDMSTVGPKAFRAVAGRLPEGVYCVDAPVRGSVPEASAERLAIYVGAEPADFDRVAPILDPLGTVHHVGGPGAGAATKVVATRRSGQRSPRSARLSPSATRWGWTEPCCSTCWTNPRSARPCTASGAMSSRANTRRTSR